MKKIITVSTILLVFFGQALFTFSIQRVQAFDYVINDTNFYPTPDVARPAKGVPYIDPNFHTEIVRITDAKTETIGGSSQKDYAWTGYPKHDIENADGTKLLIQAETGSGYFLYNALPMPQFFNNVMYPAYGLIKAIPINILGYVGRQDARWSTIDPNIFYYVGGLTRTSAQGKIIKYDIRDDSVSIVYDPALDPDWNAVTCTGVATPVWWCTGAGTPSGYGGASPTLQEEGDGDVNRRYFAYAMSGPVFEHGNTQIRYKGAIVLDILTGTVISKILSKRSCYVPGALENDNWANPQWVQDPGYTAMSPDGRWVLFGDIIKRYPSDFSFVYGLDANNHSDVGIDAIGRNVWIGAQDYAAPGDITRKWAKMTDIETGEVFLLAPIGPYGSNYHVSGNATDKPGWAVYSTFSASGDQNQWYVKTVFMVELKRSFPKDTGPFPSYTNHTRVWRLATTHSLTNMSGKDDLFAKINKKGTKVWFTSGWGTSYSQIRTAPAQTDVYQINLPATWYEDLKVISSDTTSPQAPTNVTVT